MSILLLPAVAIIVVFIGLASFRYIELPMIALGKRVAGAVKVGRAPLDGPTLETAP